MERELLLSIYRNRISEAADLAVVHKKKSDRFSILRLFIFVLAIPTLYFIIKTNFLFLCLFLLFAIGLFVYAVIQQEHNEKLYRQQESLKAINENEINAIVHHQNDYYDGNRFQVDNHLYTDDLDVFGSHSIYGLINRCKTYLGNEFLSRSFLRLPTIAEIQLHQEAVRELSEDLDFRQSVSMSLYDLEGEEQNDIATKVKRQMEMDLSFVSSPILSTFIKILPILWIVILGLYFYAPSIANTLASVLFIGNLILVGKFTKEVSQVQSHLANTSNALRKYISVLKIIFDKQWTSQLLIDRYEQFDREGEEPVAALSSLGKIIKRLDYRLNFLVGVVGNGMFLMDLGTILKLVGWKKNNKNTLQELFEHIGFIEYMNSLATWAYNHPQYAYPEIHENYLDIKSLKVEHPLIPESQNVANDFGIDPSHDVVIITGSNMSGKSTLLRTLGLNMILGYTGTKVAAKEMSYPIVKIVTYMRIKDALEENVSTFKAELNRIKLIFDLLESEDRAFILIDEMLRGTNSKDKLQGSIRITKKLLDTDAYAMIATHDIQLAELGNEDARLANYYFDIDYEEGELVFDYKVKKGICKNFNASFLLQQLGV